VETLNSGEAFAAMDRILDQARTGPMYLRQPAIADVVVEVLYYCDEELGHYALQAFAVMPNHVHILAVPHVALPKAMKALKGFTAKRANQILGLTGTPFWQDESYDHLVRDGREFERLKRYIEENPVRAGLAGEPSEYRWSSAGSGTGRSPADQEVGPTPGTR
jgi:putative transposase